MAAAHGEKRAHLLEGRGAKVVGSNLKEAIIAMRFFVMDSRYQYQAEQLENPTYYEEPQSSIDSLNNDLILNPIMITRIEEYLSSSAGDNI